MNKSAFAFIYPDMNPGGIQKYINNYLEIYLNAGFDCFWLAPKNPSVDKGFSQNIARTTLLRRNKKAVDAALSGYETVIALSFSPLDLECISALTRDITNVHHFLLIPHFKNPEIHLEELFSSEKKRAKYLPEVAKCYKEYIEQNRLFYINEKHGLALSEHYGLDPAHIGAHIAKRVRDVAPLAPEGIEARLKNRESFNIITVARFEFPHKGYILGLVDSFPEIKAEIPSARLIIIGYGEGREELVRHIDSLDPSLREDIELVGKVSYNELAAYYDRAHISVSVAGSVTDSVRFGVPALIARHYTTALEGYGFYSDNSERVLCDEPGHELISCIADVYKMNKDEYIKLCMKNHSVLEEKTMENYDPFWMTRVEQPTAEYKKKPIIRKLRGRMKRWIFFYRLKMLFTNPAAFFDKLRNRFARARGKK